MEKPELYPLKFIPILKYKPWGGDKLCRMKNIKPEPHTGESWEISNIPKNESIVANGPLKDKTLTDIIRLYKEELLGKETYEQFGEKFPLLVKFIDAKENLSIQVHPNDAVAKEQLNTNGKTEMWYVMEAEPKARIFAGCNAKITPENYIKFVKNAQIVNFVKGYSANTGDTFFIPAGLIHSIGAGCLIVEIQQPSDITYRLYAEGRYERNKSAYKKMKRLRMLAAKTAGEAIDCDLNNSYNNAKIPAVQLKNTVNDILSCQYFDVKSMDFNANKTLKPAHLNDTFYIYICMAGKAVFIDQNKQETPLQQGETVLIPATTKINKILFQEDSKMLITHVPKKLAEK
jgi:mannose-6-phosphate isomerase